MNIDDGSSASSSLSNPRKDRGAIAAQACETCRARKQKCDEQRPKCGVCQRGNHQCFYREPLPTKKDKTLVELLALQKSMGAKVDVIYDLFLNRATPTPLSFGSPHPLPSTHFSPSSRGDSMSSNAPSSSATPLSFPTSMQPSPIGVGRSPPYRHHTASHKILMWDAMRKVLLQATPAKLSDLKHIEKEGPSFLLWVYRNLPLLPLVPLEESLKEAPFLSMQSQATRATEGKRVSFPSLTPQEMLRLATAFFDTFNYFYFLMDRQIFVSEPLLRVQMEGFNGDTDSVIVLLVLALGEVACEGVAGASIEQHAGRQSGLKGGTTSKPPGLALFNEARKRMGFTLTDCDLETVQIYSLAALYYQACSRYVDFWRLTVYASSACHTLVTCKPIDWSSTRGELIKRAFWHCAIVETALYLELDLPLSPIVSLEGMVDLPRIDVELGEADERGNMYSNWRHFYISQLALRRMCHSLNNSITDLASTSNSATPTSEFGGLPPSLLKQLASQLTEWRATLPPGLQWDDSDPTCDPPIPPTYGQPVDPNIMQHGDVDITQDGVVNFMQDGDPNIMLDGDIPRHRPFFDPDLDSVPLFTPFAYDIQVALLRTRYYYAKFVAHRPFLYKALHFPEHMTQEDADGAAICLQSCVKWPLLFSPPSRHKRLIPYLSCWSQNFLGIILVMHVSKHNSMLSNIRMKRCGATFEADIGLTIELILDWMRDLRSTCPIARWGCDIIQGIYTLRPESDRMYFND